MGQKTMFLFPTRCLFNAMINAMINAIFTGGVSHGVICIKEPPYRLKGKQAFKGTHAEE